MCIKFHDRLRALIRAIFSFQNGHSIPKIGTEGMIECLKVNIDLQMLTTCHFRQTWLTK